MKASEAFRSVTKYEVVPLMKTYKVEGEAFCTFLTMYCVLRNSEDICLSSEGTCLNSEDSCVNYNDAEIYVTLPDESTGQLVKV